MKVLRLGFIFQVKIKAAKGNGMAITEIMFLDAPMDSFQTYNYEEEQDLSDDQCSCCLEEPVVCVSHFLRDRHKTYNVEG